MNRTRWFAFVLTPLLATAYLGACSSTSDRKPFVPSSPNGGRINSPSGGRGEGGDGSDSSGGQKGSGGESEPSSGGDEGSGGAESSGGNTGVKSMRLSEFEEDFTLSPLHFNRVGTASAFVGTWHDVSYETAPVDLPSSASAYRFVPSAADKFHTTFTVAFPPRELEAMGVLSRLGLNNMFAQLQVFDEPNAEQAQLVVYVHDQNGEPVDGAIPDVSGALDLAFFNLELWDDLATETTQDGLFWAGNISASEFLSGNYAFIVEVRSRNYAVSVPMAADAVTFVDLEVPGP